MLGQIDADRGDNRKIGDYFAHVDGAPLVDFDNHTVEAGISRIKPSTERRPNHHCNRVDCNGFNAASRHPSHRGVPPFHDPACQVRGESPMQMSSFRLHKASQPALLQGQELHLEPGDQHSRS